MWQPIFNLAKSTALVLTITADESTGKLLITINPKPAKAGAPAALSQPLSLRASPEDLDRDFVEAVTKFTGAYVSMKETVEASIAVMNAAKEEAAKKANPKGGMRGASKPAVVARPTGEADEDGSTAADDEPDETHTAGEEAQASADEKPLDSKTINLFA